MLTKARQTLAHNITILAQKCQDATSITNEFKQAIRFLLRAGLVLTCSWKGGLRESHYVALCPGTGSVD